MWKLLCLFHCKYHLWIVFHITTIKSSIHVHMCCIRLKAPPLKYNLLQNHENALEEQDWYKPLYSRSLTKFNWKNVKICIWYDEIFVYCWSITHCYMYYVHINAWISMQFSAEWRMRNKCILRLLFLRFRAEYKKV